PQALWDALEASGLTLTWVPDTLGGAGAEVIDGFQVLRVAGRFAAPVPLAETLLAGWLLAQAKITAPTGPMTIAPVYEDGHIELADHTLSGRARHVPFARNARHIAVLTYQAGTPSVALVPADGLAISQGTSLAGEPRDTVSFDGTVALAVAPAPARWRSPSCGSARRPGPARQSRIRCTARWALPTSTRCTTRRAGCGRGARNSATRRIGGSSSATWWPRAAPMRCGRLSPRPDAPDQNTITRQRWPIIF